MNKAIIISIVWNLVFVFGLVACAYGFWLAWHPLGYIGGGVVVALLGYGGGFEQARDKGRRR